MTPPAIKTTRRKLPTPGVIITPNQKQCPRCVGWGCVSGEQCRVCGTMPTCPDCKGTGWVKGTERRRIVGGGKGKR
jgi:DnaJ-class molecular chaperone